jgi:hypothetical protein
MYKNMKDEIGKDKSNYEILSAHPEKAVPRKCF